MEIMNKGNKEDGHCQCKQYKPKILCHGTSAHMESKELEENDDIKEEPGTINDHLCRRHILNFKKREEKFPAEVQEEGSRRDPDIGLVALAR